MKKILVLLMTLGLFVAACNTKAGKNNLATREKDDYVNRDNKNREEDDGNKWSVTDRNKYTRQCLDEASNKGIDNEMAGKICSCSLEKMEKTFSSYADADGTSSNATVIANSIKDCAAEVSGNTSNTTNTEGWSQADEDQWMKTCATPLIESMGEQKATNYCSCVLDKIKEKYSSFEEANTKGTKEIGIELGKKCIKELGIGQ